MTTRAEKTPAGPVAMTRAAFGDYVRALAPLMRLGHWDIESPDEAPQDRDAWASVNAWDGKFGATVRVAESLLGESEATVRECACHELIHCHLAHADRLAQAELAGKAGAAWRVANEYAVSALAQAVAPHLPLPSQILGKKGE